MSDSMKENNRKLKEIKEIAEEQKPGHTAGERRRRRKKPKKRRGKK